MLVLCIVMGLASACGPRTEWHADPLPAAARHHVVVQVAAPATGTGVRMASGVRIAANGVVVTAAHVARARGRGAVIRSADGTRQAATVVYIEADSDFAVLRSTAPWPGKPGPPLLSDTPRPGEAVWAPGLTAPQRVEVRRGRVRSRGAPRTLRFGKFAIHAPLVVEMRIEPGFSGAPLFNEQDRWLGMIAGFELLRQDNGKLVNTGETYVVPAARIMRRLRQLELIPAADE